MERRILPSSEVRASATGGKLKVSGYAARYGVLSRAIQPGLKERISKRAFDKVLRSKPDVVATFNHDNNVILGRTTSGTLQLRSDENGLAFDCDLPNTTTARDLYESVKRGDINGCSFAFKLGDGDDSFGEEPDDEVRGSRVIVRTINNFSNLFDVALVTSPAYPGTSVDARNLVSAELRSRVEQHTPYQLEGESADQWKRRTRSLGLCRCVRMVITDSDSDVFRRRRILLF